MSEQIETIAGFPPCPICDEVLKLRSMPDAGEKHWHCPACKTEWDVLELIEALNQIEELACVLATGRVDDEV